MVEKTTSTNLPRYIEISAWLRHYSIFWVLVYSHSTLELGIESVPQAIAYHVKPHDCKQYR